MPLIECPDIYGHTKSFDHRPECQVHEHVLYIPKQDFGGTPYGPYGLFGADGGLIRAAGRFRGPDGAHIGPGLSTPQGFTQTPVWPDDRPFFYLDHFTNHYGHFLLDTLCRLWALDAYPPDCPVLYHGSADPAAFFAQPFSRAVFTALGITQERLVKFDHPVILPRVIIASPSIEELNFSHRIFAGLLNRVGAAILAGGTAAPNATPAYLTKMRVKSGISRYVNEDAFADRLAKAGVDIIAPEEFSLRNQIEIFQSRPVISGLIGSAMHTSAFLPGRKMLILNYQRTVWSNQILIDNANGGKSTFVCDDRGSENLGPDADFGNNFRMADPVGLAEDFLRRLEPFAAVSVKNPARKNGCVAIVKNEERHIAEWVAWQFAIGFDTVILLDNNSTDRTRDAALAATAQDVRVYEWPMATPDYQQRAYAHAAEKFGAEFEWLAFFDTDEFLVLDDGLDLKSWLASINAAAIGVPWALFGSSGHAAAPSGLVTENYLHRAPADFGPNRHVKSIIRPALLKRVQNPHAFEMDGIYVDPAGRELAWSLPGFQTATPNYAVAKLHHYFTRSWTDWQAKLRRGYPDLVRPESEFSVYDRNDISDESALRLTPRVRQILDHTTKKTCAVVLVVKDEASDIAAWLAWYHILGFNACIAFDDESTDGTLEILQKAAAAQDIRLHTTKGPRPGDYIHRQDESYRFALKEYAEEFEWLAFFDADEFLRLHQDSNVKSFLSRFPDADAIAVNWCNYGSAGHLLKPALLPIKAYTWHGDEQEVVNRHVKSFVRPSKVGDRWRNVHCYDVAPERYVLANGAPARWGQVPGIIAENPDWRVAKLMHYQCRSMEHFIERLKKRPELAAIPGIWHAYDFHAAQDVTPAALAPELKAQIAAITQTHAAGTVIENLIFDIGMSEGNDSAFYLAKGFRVVGVEADAEIYLALCERFAAEIKTGAMTIHNAAASDTAGQIVEFFHHDHFQGLSGLRNTRPEFGPGNFKSYHVLTIDWPFLIAKHGVPHYAKIDIEGQEAAFLQGAIGTAALPAYISVECHAIDPVEQLHRLGYNLFKLVDQNPPGGFLLPSPQFEGDTIAWTNWSHASGPFGRDLPGDWVPFETFRQTRQAAQPDYARTWFDCHAKRQ